jgi:Ca2+-binding RTX toxin-like protein
MNGGNGNDTWLGSDYGDTFRVNSNLANLTSIETINGGGSYDTILGTSDADVLNFSSGPTLLNIEEINGGGGNDTITGKLLSI